jgi:hypothetical protein
MHILSIFGQIEIIKSMEQSFAFIIDLAIKELTVTPAI